MSTKTYYHLNTQDRNECLRFMELYFKPPFDFKNAKKLNKAKLLDADGSGLFLIQEYEKTIHNKYENPVETLLDFLECNSHIFRQKSLKYLLNDFSYSSQLNKYKIDGKQLQEKIGNFIYSHANKKITSAQLLFQSSQRNDFPYFYSFLIDEKKLSLEKNKNEKYPYFYLIRLPYFNKIVEGIKSPFDMVVDELKKIPNNYIDNNGRNPLHHLAAAGFELDLFKDVFKHEQYFELDKKGNTPLFYIYTVPNANIDKNIALYEKMNGINILNKQKRNFLQEACVNSQKHFYAKSLLTHKFVWEICNLDLKNFDIHGNNLLSIMVQSGFENQISGRFTIKENKLSIPKAVQDLLETANDKNKNGYFPIEMVYKTLLEKKKWLINSQMTPLQKNMCKIMGYKVNNSNEFESLIDSLSMKRMTKKTNNNSGRSLNNKIKLL